MGAGDDAVWEDLAILLEAPAGKLVATGTTTFNDNVSTAWSFASADIDTEDEHDPAAPTRITPNIAGMYFFIGTSMPGARADWADMNTGWRKNGSANRAPWTRNQPIATSSIQSQIAWAFEQMNGTTDYMEFMGQYNNTGSANQASNQSGQYSAGVAWFLVGGIR